MPVLRQHLRYRLAGRLGSLLARLAHATWRVRVIDPDGAREGLRDGSRRAIVAFWHRHILTMMAHHQRFRVCVPVSESRDGEYVAHVMERLGFVSVRGSSSRGRLRLIKGVLDEVRRGRGVVITPDGPLGPPYQVQPGVALLAERSGLPVQPVGVAVQRAWVTSSWDRFVIPKPGSRIVIVFGPLLRASDYEGTAAFCDAVRDGIFAATEQARQALRAGA
jgi:hypothetical protein